MQKYLIFAAFGWLVFTGIGHFGADVLSQYMRGKRIPGPETTLYYGLNTAYAFGQLIFGLLGLYFGWRALNLMTEPPVLILAAVAGTGWLVMAFMFMEYWEPKGAAAIFLSLILAAAAMRLR